VAATAGHLHGRGGKVHEERVCAQRVLEMAKEASPVGVADNDSVSSPSEHSWYQEPTSGFLSASLGELGESEAPDLIASRPAEASRQIAVDGHRAEPAARDQLRLEMSDAPGGGTEQRGELLTGQKRVARNQGEYLVDLAWRISVLVATVGQRAVEWSRSLDLSALA